jgi:NADH dehydrogenase FAD-containing subunit
VGTLEFRTALEPIRSRRQHIAFFQGWADAVDFKTKTLTIEEAVDDPQQGLSPTEDRRSRETTEERRHELTSKMKKGELFNLKYDKLVIAVGAYSQTFGTPGVKEHAYFLKDVGDARKIRNRLLQCKTAIFTFLVRIHVTTMWS